MELTPVERLILSNQYRILEKLEPDAGWGRFRETIDHGYPLHLDRLVRDSMFEPLTREECQEVRDTLSVYERIQDAHRAHPGELTDIEVQFPGYGDGDEAKYALFVDFMHRNREWAHLDKAPNALVPMAAFYRELLQRWRAAHPTRLELVSSGISVAEARRLLAR